MDSEDALAGFLVKEVEEKLLVLPFDKWMTAYHETVKIIQEKVPNLKFYGLDEHHAKIWYFRYRRLSFETYMDLLDSILGCYGKEKDRVGLGARILPGGDIPEQTCDTKRRRTGTSGIASNNRSDDAYLRSLFTRREKLPAPLRNSGKPTYLHRKSGDAESNNVPVVRKCKMEFMEVDAAGTGIGREESLRDSFWKSFESEPMLVSLVEEDGDDKSTSTLRANVSPLATLESAFTWNKLCEKAEGWKNQLKLIQIPPKDQVRWKAHVMNKLSRTPQKPAFLTAEEFHEDRLNRFEDPRYTALLESSECMPVGNEESAAAVEKYGRSESKCKQKCSTQAKQSSSANSSFSTSSSTVEMDDQRKVDFSLSKPGGSFLIPAQHFLEKESKGQCLPILSICPPVPSISDNKVHCNRAPLLPTPDTVRELSLTCKYSTGPTFPGKSLPPPSYWQQFPTHPPYPEASREVFLQTSQHYSFPKEFQKFHNFQPCQRMTRPIIGETCQNFHPCKRRPPPPPQLSNRHTRDFHRQGFYRDTERDCSYPRRVRHPGSNLEDFDTVTYGRRLNDFQGSYLEEIR